MKRLYEAMFVVDSAKAKENYDAIEGVAKNCILRYGGEIVSCIKWDDRKLAYDIRGVKRGTFILIHFVAEGETIAKIERQARLAEEILRVLIVIDQDGIETTTGGAKARAESEIESEMTQQDSGEQG